MSEDECEIIDVESEFEEYDKSGNNKRTLDKRAQHSAFERKRRDHIKASFEGLKDAIPTMKAGHNSSRAQILKKASEYIENTCRNNHLNQADRDELKRQNDRIEAQITALLTAAMFTNLEESAAETLKNQGLLEEGEFLPTQNDLKPSVQQQRAREVVARAVNSGQSLLLGESLPTPNNLEPFVPRHPDRARPVAPGQSLLLNAAQGRTVAAVAQGQSLLLNNSEPRGSVFGFPVPRKKIKQETVSEESAAEIR